METKGVTTETRVGYSDQYEKALQMAAVAHRHQERKGSSLPYIVHPVQVSVILLRHGFPIEVAVAGLLHDVVEDQEYELDEIKDRFGPRVARMVDALSEQKRDAQGAKRPWETRKREALERMHEASPETVAVKAADALHNVRSFALDLQRDGPGIWRYFNRGAISQMGYYRKVLGIARERLGDHPLVDGLASALDDLAALIDEVGAEGDDRG